MITYNNDDKVPLRNLQLDALKGFAILLVVLGHSIQWHVKDFDNNILFRIIYSFHMPLFMFISGYLAFGRIKAFDIRYIYKKFKGLIIPCVAWYLLNYLMHHVLRHFSFDFYVFIKRL